jgi:hypothetical protein
MEHESAIVKAPKLAKLCSACYEMLNLRLKPESDGPYVREQTLEEFKEAAVQKCAICSLIWNLTAEHARAWSQFPIDTWEPMEYVTPASRRLMLFYSDPVRGEPMHLSLDFIGPEGNMPQISHRISFLRRING